MKSKTTGEFWKCHEKLPAEIRKHAKKAYNFFFRDPYTPALHFKRIHSTRPIFSVRISMDYRAIGIFNENEIIWFWIGSHEEYNNLLKKIRKT